MIVYAKWSYGENRCDNNLVKEETILTCANECVRGEGGLIRERDKAQLVRRAEGRRPGMLLLQGRRQHHQVWVMVACGGSQAQTTVEVRH